MKRIFGITFLLLIFSIGMALAEESHGRIGTLTDRHDRVTREIQIKKKKHEDLQKREKSLLDHLDHLAFTLDRKTKELSSLERELSQTEKAISSQKKEMNRLRDQMSITQKQIQTRVAALYRISKVSPWAFLLSAEKYGDFLRMFTFVYSMIDHDVRLLTTFQQQLDRKEAIQRKLAAYQSRLQEKKIKVRQKKQENETLRRQKERALKEVRSAKTSFAKVVQGLEKQAKKLQSLMKTLPTQEESTSWRSSGFWALKGRLPVPVAGKIETKVPSGLRGISLKAPLGTMVRAVYKGRVVYADWFKGYGNLLIIDHGDKFHTVMGHASELLKRVNDPVEAGEPVARVGSTGSLGEPSLHFEIRHGGRPLNPLDWFSREDRLALRRGKK